MKNRKLRVGKYVFRAIINSIKPSIVSCLVLTFFEGILYALIADTTFAKKYFPYLYFASLMVVVAIVIYVKAVEQMEEYEYQEDNAE